jgi:hypothetical protein
MAPACSGGVGYTGTRRCSGLVPDPPHILHQRIGRHRPSQELLDHLPSRALQTEAKESRSDRRVPGDIAHSERPVKLPGPLANGSDENRSRGLIHHVTRRVHQLPPHGPPGELGVGTDPEVVVGETSPYPVRVGAGVPLHPHLEQRCNECWRPAAKLAAYSGAAASS